jgi:hypothetical protein
MLKVSEQMGNDYGIYQHVVKYKIKNNKIDLWFEDGGESWAEGYSVTSQLRFQEIKNYW